MNLNIAVICSVALHAAAFVATSIYHTRVAGRIGTPRQQIMQVTLHAPNMKEIPQHKPSRDVPSPVTAPVEEICASPRQMTSSPESQQSALPEDPVPGAALAEYYARIRSHIIKHKYYPPRALRSGDEGSITLAFSIDKNGLLKELSLTNRCRSPLLNTAARDTVTRSAPFPAFPSSIKEDLLQLSITLDYSLTHLF